MGQEKAEDSRSGRKFIGDVWQFARPFRANLWRAAFWTTAMQVLALVEPYLLMFIIDDVMRHGVESKARVPWFALGAFGLLIITTLTKILKDRRIRYVVAAIRSETHAKVLDKLLRLPLAYHHGTNASESADKAHEGVGKVDEIIWISLYELTPLIIHAAVTITALAWMHWSIALMMLVTMCVHWTSLILVKRAWQNKRVARHKLLREAGHDFGESVANVLTVQAFGREPEAVANDLKKRGTWKDMFLSEMAAYDRSHILRNSLINAVRVSSIVLCAWLYFGDHLTIGQWVFIQMLVERLLNANFQLGGIYDRFVDAAEPVHVLAEVMREPETQTDPPDPLPIPDGSITLSLDGVTYAYPSRPDSPALQGVSFVAKPGMMVGIVGESGHGKSTLAKLLLRYDDPQGGSIALNGVDLRKTRKADIRLRIGYVPQEVELFSDTIAANIRYGQPEASDEAVIRAAKLARAHDFILKTEKGYDTQIGDRGLRLSGGERQRVGIARAILTGSPVLIFDEATSSVDAETIYEIKRAMNGLRGERTLVVITHQLSTVQDADLIIVLKDGRVSGTGTHAELVRSNKLYQGFVQRQQREEASLHVTNPSTLS